MKESIFIFVDIKEPATIVEVKNKNNIFVFLLFIFVVNRVSSYIVIGSDEQNLDNDYDSQIDDNEEDLVVENKRRCASVSANTPSSLSTSKSSTETHPPPPHQSLNSQIQSRVDPKTRIMEVLDIASGILKPKNVNTSSTL